MKIFFAFVTGILSLNCWAIDIYNPVNRQLTIPTVQVGQITYTNVVVTLENILSIVGGSPSGAVDSYDASKNQLTIPAVQVYGNVYNNVLINIGSVLSVDGSFTNPNILMQNTRASITDIAIFPSDGFDYSSINFAYGHLGNASNNCFLTIGVSRKKSQSSPSYPNPPLYIFCQQSDESFKEVSKQLLGQNYNISAGNAVLADFNKDGVDDIFIVESWDGAGSSLVTYTFISNPQGKYQMAKSPIDNKYNFNIQNPNVAIDINNDGCLDVVNAFGFSWLGDCSGNFKSTFINNSTSTYSFGQGLCAGDFLGNGKNSLVVTDATLRSNPVNQGSNIFELDSSASIFTAAHPLPVPYWNVLLNQPGAALTFTCQVADINRDGKLDLILYTTPWPSAIYNGWTDNSYVQIYLNQGNWNFLDISASALPTYNTKTALSYNSRLIDINGDGYTDIILDGQAYSGLEANGNQIWLNKKNNTFEKVFDNELLNLYMQIPKLLPNTILSMLPIKVNNAWNYIVEYEDADHIVHLGIANTNFVFK